MKNAPFRAFTLIEIMACTGIFAVGFAAIAMMLPAGTAMQRDIESRGMGDIVGRNALAIVQGKGAHALTFDTIGSYIPTPTALNGGYTGVASYGDMEHIVRQEGWFKSWLFEGYVEYYGHQSGPDTMWKYFNTNNDGNWGQRLGSSYSYRYPYCVTTWNNPDLTHCGLGRIHALSHRPIPGSSLGIYSILDFSYPSTLFDIQARSYFAHVMRTNQCATPLGGLGSWSVLLSLPSAHNWQVTAVVTQSHSGDEWPEQAEQNSAEAAPVYAGGDMNTPDCLASITPMNFRSRAGDSTLMTNGVAGAGGTGVPDSAALNRWPYWNPPVGTSTYGYGASWDSTVTPYGGQPSASNPMIRGWGISQMPPTGVGGIGNSWMNLYNSPGWGFFMNYVSPPIADLSTAVSGRATYKYSYPVPNVLAAYAIVYDRDNDLLLVRYPQVFANSPISGNARLANFWADMKTTPALAPDRRLKVGDSFLAAYGAIPFKVKELIDPASEFSSLPAVLQNGVTDRWADGSYQIIRVTPSLGTTPYTANKPMDAWRSWTEPSPLAIYFSPPPLAGGPSPWVSTVQLNNCNGTVFHNWDNLAD